MLFNSYIFIFAFFPAVFAAFLLLNRFGRNRLALAVTVAFSLFFYAYWRSEYIFIILGSVLVNFVLSRLLTEDGFLPGLQERFAANPQRFRKRVLALGVTLNLAAIGYFKYLFFIANSLGVADSFAPGFFEIALPIGISFYTFQQIMFLVDCYRRRYAGTAFLHYIFYVTFFPQLIAGPIVQFSDVRAQLPKLGRRFSQVDLAVGFSIFVVGLFKKVILADSIAIYVDAGYANLAAGQALDPMSAWVVAIGYSFQLYFDFSGYSDMAIGLARMFGLRLPLNFFSPYKATSIIEFWRRWHITLSRFLRDYLYVPLGGSRGGLLQQFRNVAIVMFLGGLWHGAAWTFVLWGILHGAMLVANHLLRRVLGRYGRLLASPLVSPFCILVTFTLVTLAWVPFRASSIDDAWRMYQFLIPNTQQEAAALYDGLRLFVAVQFDSLSTVLDVNNWATRLDLDSTRLRTDFIANALPVGLLLGVSAVIVFDCPNIYQIMRRYRPALGLLPFLDKGRWTDSGIIMWFIARLRPVSFAVIGVLFVISLSGMQRISPFLYFQF